MLVRAGGTWHSGGRKSGVAAPQLPTPGQRVSRQSPRWRCGATANGEPHAPRSARPAPPARPPRRSAAPLRALARQSRLGAAASRAAPASPGPSASSGRLSLTPSLPPLWGLHENFKKGIRKILSFPFFPPSSKQRFFDVFFFLFPLGSHSPAGPSAGLGAGVRGAGAAERGLKASQALQRPTRACTPPPVPAEKSSSYPRLHRSAFLFQSAGRLAAPPVSGQASCLERAPLHLLARLLAPLPGRARQLEAGGGSLRDPACSRSLCSIPAVSCLLLLSCVFPTLPCRHWCVSECMRRFCFFFSLLLCFCNPEAKAEWG